MFQVWCMLQSAPKAISQYQIMFIKALNKKQQKKQLLRTIDYASVPVKKKGCFDLPNHEDDLFTDQYWFHKNKNASQTGHSHSPMKNRMIRLKNETSSTNYRHNNKSQVNAQTLIPAKTQKIIGLPNRTQKVIALNLKNKSTHYVSFKQSVLRQPSEIPSYAKNLMKPCKIQTMRFSERPRTARKISTASCRAAVGRPRKKSALQRNTVQGDGQKIQSIRQLNLGNFNNNKIEPWQQVDQDYIIY